MKTLSEKNVTASEAKLHFGELLNRCVYGSEPIVITKHDKPVAVLVKMAEWKTKSTTKKEEDEDVHPLHKRILESKVEYKKWAAKHNIKPGPNAVELTRMGRAELDARADKWMKK